MITFLHIAVSFRENYVLVDQWESCKRYDEELPLLRSEMQNFLNYLVNRLDQLKNQQQTLCDGDDILERGKSFYFAQEIRRLEAIYAEARQIIGFILDDSSIIFDYNDIMCDESDSCDSDSSESDIDEVDENENNQEDDDEHGQMSDVSDSEEDSLDDELCIDF